MGRTRLACYSGAHFLVDLSSALLVVGRICPAGDAWTVMLLYNFCAFALQLPLGLLADRLDRNRQVAASGCLLALGAWLLPPGLAAAVTAGVGNALFHVGGGLDTLNGSRAKCGALGVFVSPGALGLFLGGLWSARWASLAPAVCVALAVAALCIMRWCVGPSNAPTERPDSGGGESSALTGLLAVVVLRSWAGLLFQFPWKPQLGAALTLAVVLGKVCGGLLADRFGPGRTAAVSLALAALCLGLSDAPALGLASVFLFNMTMPLTLWAAARLLPGTKGFAFGLLTFGLFLGFLPGHLDLMPVRPGPALYAAAALGSLPPLLWGLRAAQKGGGKSC